MAVVPAYIPSLAHEQQVEVARDRIIEVLCGDQVDRYVTGYLIMVGRNAIRWEVRRAAEQSSATSYGRVAAYWLGDGGVQHDDFVLNVVEHLAATQVFAALTPEERLVLTAYVNEGSVRKASEVLDLSVSQYRRRLRHAREHFMELWGVRPAKPKPEPRSRRDGTGSITWDKSRKHWKVRGPSPGGGQSGPTLGRFKSRSKATAALDEWLAENRAA